MDFDLEEYDQPPNVALLPPTRPRPVVKVVSKNQPAPPEVDSSNADAEAMAEVELRLELAQYYRLVLSMDSFFSDSSGPAASVVDKEIRDFVRTRMSKLVGVENSEADGMFSPTEIASLKTLAAPGVFGALTAIAAKVIRKPTLVEAPSTPTLNKVVVPKQPSLRKVSAKSIIPSTPVVATPEVVVPATPATKGASEVQVENIDGVKRITKTVIAKMIDQSTGKEADKEVVMDLTQQSRPTGNIQPIPFPTSARQIEMMSQMTASRMAEATSKAVDRTFTQQ